jgi:hypothetical protein
LFVPRSIFGPKRDEVTGGWRKLHNEKLHNLYPSPSIIRMMRWAGHVAEWGIRRMHIGYWWESQKENEPLGRPERRWVDNIKMNLRDIAWGSMDWIDLARDRTSGGLL